MLAGRTGLQGWVGLCPPAGAAQGQVHTVGSNLEDTGGGTLGTGIRCTEIWENTFPGDAHLCWVFTKIKLGGWFQGETKDAKQRSEHRMGSENPKLLRLYPQVLCTARPGPGSENKSWSATPEAGLYPVSYLPLNKKREERKKNPSGRNMGYHKEKGRKRAVRVSATTWAGLKQEGSQADSRTDSGDTAELPLVPQWSGEFTQVTLTGPSGFRCRLCHLTANSGKVTAPLSSLCCGVLISQRKRKVCILRTRMEPGCGSTFKAWSSTNGYLQYYCHWLYKYR